MPTPEAIASLQREFKTLLGGMDRVIRWGGYKDKSYQQSSLHHSMSLMTLVAYCVDRERQLGNERLNGCRLLMKAGGHDWPEGSMGDVTYVFKMDPRLRLLYKRLEDEQMAKVIGRLGPMSGFLGQVFEGEPAGEDEQFFTAMEELDYVLYAINEVHEHRHMEFVEVLRRHHGKIKAARERWPSIGDFYSADVEAWVDATLAEHPAGAPPEVPVSYVHDMADATLDVIRRCANGDAAKQSRLAALVIQELLPLTAQGANGNGNGHGNGHAPAAIADNRIL